MSIFEEQYQPTQDWIRQNKNRFCSWLERTQGAQILTPKSEWEFLRFDVKGKLSIIYHKKNKDTLTFTGESSKFYRMFRYGAP